MFNLLITDKLRNEKGRCWNGLKMFKHMWKYTYKNITRVGLYSRMKKVSYFLILIIKIYDHIIQHIDIYIHTF